MKKQEIINKINHARESMKKSQITVLRIPITGIVPFGIKKHSRSTYVQKHGKYGAIENATFWHLVIWKNHQQVMLEKVECELHSYQSKYHPLADWHSEKPTQVNTFYSSFVIELEDGNLTNIDIDKELESEDYDEPKSPEASV